MRKIFIGAVSLTALMAAGLAACGQDTTRYAEDETYTEATQAEDDARMAQTEDDAGLTPTDEAGRMAQTPAAEPTDPAEVTGDVTMAETATTVTPSDSDASLAALSEVRTREEVERVVEQIFVAADANGDGVLDRSEYLTVALADADYTDEGLGEGDWTGTTQDMAAEDMAAQEGAIPEEQPTQLASLDAQEKAEEFFDEATEDGEQMTLQEMRQAFLARFDEADEDGSGELDTLQRMKFVRLVAG